MKQLNPIFALAALLLAANACEQSPVQDQDNPQAPYYLSVDKSVIEADGKETATITLKDATGLVLTDEAHIKNVSLYVKETDTYFTRRTNTFTSIDNVFPYAFGNWDDFNFNYGLYFCLCDILERPRPDFGTKAAAQRDVEILSCTGPQLKPGRFGNVVYP